MCLEKCPVKELTEKNPADVYMEKKHKNPQRNRARKILCDQAQESSLNERAHGKNAV